MSQCCIDADHHIQPSYERGDTVHLAIRAEQAVRRSAHGRQQPGIGTDGGGETWSGGGGSEQETAEETPKDKASEEGIDLKDGVEIDDMSDEMQDVLDDIADAWDEHASDITPVITSGNEGTDGDGVHMDGSKHYTGDAVDLRTNNLTQSQIDDVSSTLSSSLGDDYDVVVESTHIHVEYDPA
jgi:hypothetical protein